MREEELKQRMDESVPDHITLTEKKKQEIFQAAQDRSTAIPSSSRPRVIPVIAGVAVLGLSGLLLYPYVDVWQNEERQQQENGLTQVVIEGHGYDVLINAEYDEQTKTLIYADDHTLFAYSIESDTEQRLTEGNQLITEVAVEGNWIAWTETDGVSLNLFNRESGEGTSIMEVHAVDLTIDDGQLSYMEVDGKQRYKLMNLETLQDYTVHELTEEGANSTAAFNEGKIVIPERFTEEGRTSTSFTVYEAESRELIGEFTVPYEQAENVTLTDNKIFAQLTNPNQEPVLGYMDLATGRLQEIDTPLFTAYAVYEEYVALSEVNETDLDTVKLYRTNGQSIEPVQLFTGIGDRLVKPRFSEGGTLLVNGEGEDFAMYLKDLDETENTPPKTEEPPLATDEENITTITTVIKEDIGGPDKKLIRLWEAAAELSSQQNPAGSNEEAAYLEYVHEKFGSYFTEHGLDSHIRNAGFMYDHLADSSGKTLEVTEVEVKNVKAPDSSFDSTPYEITAVVKGTDARGATEQFEFTGETIVSGDGLIKELTYDMNEELQAYLRSLDQ